MIFDERAACRAANLIGGVEGRVGFKTAMKVLDKGRIHIAAVCVGMSERILHDALRYAVSAAVRPGRSPSSSWCRPCWPTAGRAYAARAAWCWTRRAGATRENAIATEAACCKMSSPARPAAASPDRAVQIFGGAGYMAE